MSLFNNNSKKKIHKQKNLMLWFLKISFYNELWQIPVLYEKKFTIKHK
jgi:hypothetical protein